MGNPIQSLVLKADPEIIKAFNRQYILCRFSSDGICSECFGTFASSTRTKHRTYHKAQARIVWVIAAALDPVMVGKFIYKK